MVTVAQTVDLDLFNNFAFPAMESPRWPFSPSSANPNSLAEQDSHSWEGSCDAHWPWSLDRSMLHHDQGLYHPRPPSPSGLPPPTTLANLDFSQIQIGSNYAAAQASGSSQSAAAAAAATAAAPGWQRDSEGVATFQGLSSRSHADFIADLLMRVPQGSKAPSRASTTSSTAAFGMESATLQSIDILAQDPYADGGPMSNASSKQTHLSHSTLDLQERAGASADTQEASSPGGGGGGTEQTTVMIRNLPVSSSQDRVVKEMDLEGKIDFLYLPRSGAGQTNLGYAFINFVNDEFALQFQEQWHKQRLPDCPTRKSLNISFATIQGLRANVMQVKKKRRRCLEVRQCHPIIMMHGRQVSLDEALDIYNGKAEPLSAGAA